jgi:hypothetical protein
MQKAQKIFDESKTKKFRFPTKRTKNPTIPSIILITFISDIFQTSPTAGVLHFSTMKGS